MPVFIDYIHDDDGLGGDCECDGCAEGDTCEYDVDPENWANPY